MRRLIGDCVTANAQPMVSIIGDCATIAHMGLCNFNTLTGQMADGASVSLTVIAMIAISSLPHNSIISA